MRQRTSPGLAWVLVAVLLTLRASAAWAQGPGVTVNDVAEDLYCPLCSGLTVDVCELEVCADMRTTIEAKLAAGESPEQIKAYFVEQYGQKVVGKPATEGFHLTAWIMPFAVLLGAGALLALWLRRRPVATLQVVPATRPSNDYHARLERELQRLEE